jgi:ketosteroid isomerase-like protein
MTEHPNVGLTRRGYDAFAAGDLAALSELLADDGPGTCEAWGRSAATTTGGTTRWCAEWMICMPLGHMAESAA